MSLADALRASEEVNDIIMTARAVHGDKYSDLLKYAFSLSR
jgi:hypothetical protein